MKLKLATFGFVAVFFSLNSFADLAQLSKFNGNFVGTDSEGNKCRVQNVCFRDDDGSELCELTIVQDNPINPFRGLIQDVVDQPSVSGWKRRLQKGPKTPEQRGPVVQLNLLDLSLDTRSPDGNIRKAW